MSWKLNHPSARTGVLGLATAALLASGSAACAQGQPELVKRRDEKLAQPFLKKAPWSTDYVKVREEARKQGRFIFAVFSRSYSPSPECQALEEGPLSSPAFAEFGKQVVLLYHLTSLVREDDYQDLMQKKGGRGYPYVAFLDDKGEVVAAGSTLPPADKPADKPDSAVAGWTTTLRDLTQWRESKRKVDGGDKSARKALLLAELALGKTNAKDVRARLKDIGTLTKDERGRIDLALVNLDARDLVEQSQTRAGLMTAGKKLVEMKQTRRIPTEGYLPIQFWTALVNYGIEIRDWRLCEDSIGEFKKGAKDQPALLKTVETLEDTLRRARG
jgi:hypothetical protein